MGWVVIKESMKGGASNDRENSHHRWCGVHRVARCGYARCEISQLQGTCVLLAPLRPLSRRFDGRKYSNTWAETGGGTIN